jgi:hypothetical protein
MKRLKIYKKFKNEYFKKNEEFRMGDTETAPVTTPAPETVPVTPDSPPRPWRPVPTVVPRPGTEEHPIGEFAEVMDMFFKELDNIKDTQKGKEMIKTLQNKYGNF